MKDNIHFIGILLLLYTYILGISLRHNGIALVINMIIHYNITEVGTSGRGETIIASSNHWIHIKCNSYKSCVL